MFITSIVLLVFSMRAYIRESLKSLLVVALPSRNSLRNTFFQPELFQELTAANPKGMQIAPTLVPYLEI